MNQAQRCNLACPRHSQCYTTVLSSPENAVESLSARPPIRTLFLFLALFLVYSASWSRSAIAQTTSLDDAVRVLAERVTTIPNLRGPLRLQFFQDPAFSAETGEGWQQTFRTEIQNHHLDLSEDPSAKLLRVGVAETPTQLVLSAAVRVSEKDEVRFLALPRIAFEAASLPVAPIRIERQLVYQTPDLILDASSIGHGAEGGMALLATHNFVLTVLHIAPSGQPTQTIALPAAGIPPSRDPRGELTIRANDGTAVLPSMSCDFTWTAPTESKCRSSKTIWRTPTVLTPSCGTGGWKLVADGPDRSTPDVLQVVPDGSLRQGSAVLLSDFPGPVLSINGEQNPASALVVSKNLRTGNYEVYKVTLACDN